MTHVLRLKKKKGRSLCKISCDPVKCFQPVLKMDSWFHLKLSFETNYVLYEPEHDQTNEMSCAPIEDLDQLRYLPNSDQSSLSA